MKSSDKHIHPGQYVRQNIIPSNMTVKAAAERLGVGRVALSNFLNGNSSLSSDMATRLEKTFGADRKNLIELQEAYDRPMRLDVETEIEVRAFVPNFLTIKATQIEQWANSLDARSTLPVLLRILIHSTGGELQGADFPGYDNAQRKGSDGYLVAGTATPWIPKGRSYWEFGTNQNPQAKAESDYNARLTSTDADERSNSTFVFVTPRNWPGKTAWQKQKNNSGEWMSVKALDASDLEQWLEQSIPGQIWLAEQLDLPAYGYETLDRVWLRWANATNPKLTKEIFALSIAAHRDALKTWLEKTEIKPLIISADSRDEALAFLACLFDDEKLRNFKDIAAVFTSPENLRKILISSIPLIPIVHTEETEQELAIANRMRYIVFRPRNAADVKPDIVSDPLDHETFKKALETMEIEEDKIDRLARESAYSPTILRRRLSSNTAIRTPDWAGNNDMVRSLVQLALIGAWHAELEADRKIVSWIANRDYEEVDHDIMHLLRCDDSPVWSSGQYRGVISKTDALFSIAMLITKGDIDRFFEIAEYVLSESDPALELPEKDRFAAAVYGKKRNHSAALRDGICETLVLLAVYGKSLFQSRLGVNVEVCVTSLIRKLITPLTLEKLQSHNYDLPSYAEAAPDEFLKIIEEDLQRNDPVLLGILKPVDSSIFGMSPPRTGLLWALEFLAWKPQNLSRVSKILARLSQQKINDNWANKPEESLQAIFRSWMPQTAASLEQRIKALEKVIEFFPDVAWRICIEQIKTGSRIGSFSYRPRWRNDASGAGRGVTIDERVEFERKALDLLIAWPSHDENTLGELVKSFEGLTERKKSEIWDLIDKWAPNAGELAKAVLREQIRIYAFSRIGRRRNLGEAARERARKVYDSLQPQDTVIRHNWLFVKQWVEESADELEDENFDYAKHDERIDRLRREAMAEIIADSGFDGVKELLCGSEDAHIIGRYVSLCTVGVSRQVVFIQRCLGIEEECRSKAEWFIQGFLRAIEEEARTELLRAAAEDLSVEDLKRLFTLAPFGASTWRLLEDYDENLRIGYWKNVFPSWGRFTPAELNELIDCLLASQRPRAAFNTVHLDFKNIETSRLKRLLYDIATVDAEPADQYKLDRYYISEALDSLDGRASVTRDEMAQLEFLFIRALDDSRHGIPNLEDQLIKSPALFVNVLAHVYKRNDDGGDPPEWRIGDEKKRSSLASACYHLLDQLRKIPGTDEKGRIQLADLSAWLDEVRRLCSEYGRAEIGDHCIGHLLAKAPECEAGQWPCEAVCEAMENIASQGIAAGFRIGVYNSRGVQFRDKGGQQERELSAKYRNLAERLHYTYPYVGNVLEGIAASYDYDATREDSEDEINKRLQH